MYIWTIGMESPRCAAERRLLEIEYIRQMGVYMKVLAREAEATTLWECVGKAPRRQTAVAGHTR